MSDPFNLIDEPWIPFRMPDGRSAKLGLLDTLIQAPKIREIHDASPLVTVALHRLLLAILHRNFGPRSVDAWAELWNAGHWDETKLRGYFDAWRPRFNLFDSHYPFFQSAGFASESVSPIGRVSAEIASGNSATLFDHSLDTHPMPVTFAEAARLIVAHQAFALRGSAGAVAGGARLPNYKHAPLLAGVTVLLQGENLFQTLALNLLRYDPQNDVPIPKAGKGDQPLWERGGITPRQVRIPEGYLDWLTWPSRSLRLEVGVDGKVASLHYGHGEERPEAHTLLDPMMAFHADSKRGLLPVRLREEHDLWRDSHSLVRAAARDDIPPGTLAWLAELVNEGVLPRQACFRLSAFGLCSDQAKIHYWRHEQLPLPAAYLIDDDLYRWLVECLNKAEEVGGNVRRACWLLAHDLLAANAGANPNKDAVAKLFIALSTEIDFWAGLEVPFRRLLTMLPAEPELRFRQWLDTLRRAATVAWEAATAKPERSARSLRAIVGAEAFLHRLQDQTLPYGGEL